MSAAGKDSRSSDRTITDDLPAELRLRAIEGSGPTWEVLANTEDGTPKLLKRAADEIERLQRVLRTTYVEPSCGEHGMTAEEAANGERYPNCIRCEEGE